MMDAKAKRKAKKRSPSSTLDFEPADATAFRTQSRAKRAQAVQCHAHVRSLGTATPGESLRKASQSHLGKNARGALPPPSSQLKAVKSKRRLQCSRVGGSQVQTALRHTAAGTGTLFLARCDERKNSTQKAKLKGARPMLAQASPCWQLVNYAEFLRPKPASSTRSRGAYVHNASARSKKASSSANPRL